MNSRDEMGFHMISPSNVGLFMGIFRGIVDQFMMEIQPVKEGAMRIQWEHHEEKKTQHTMGL